MDITISIDQSGHVSWSGDPSPVAVRIAIERQIDELRARLAVLDAARRALTVTIEGYVPGA